MKFSVIAVIASFIAAPAFAEDAVVVPDNGSTVIHQEGRHGDKDIIIQKQPDAVVVPEEHHDVTVTPDNGPGSGETGVEAERHYSVPPADDR